MAAAGGELGEEEARLKLTQILLDARPRISALISRDGRLAKVISIDARVPRLRGAGASAGVVADRSTPSPPKRTR